MAIEQTEVTSQSAISGTFVVMLGNLLLKVLTKLPILYKYGATTLVLLSIEVKDLKVRVYPTASDDR